MGQRHQIYVALPPPRFQPTEHKRVVGIHHQWLYGHTAIRMAERFLTFIKNADDSSNPFVSGFGDPAKALAAIYSCDPEHGYFHNVHILEHGETADPRLGDNNDGITIFDLRAYAHKDPRVAYCFVSLDGHQGLPEMQAVSARRYVQAYYPEHVAEHRSKKRVVPSMKDGEPNVPEQRTRALEDLGFAVMTNADLHAIFPAAFPSSRPAPTLVLPELGE